ncbi:Retrovirus-related Pol polyprotein from transposon TNT 1-94 [Vitis vinifera]|uniref:Retrovirus-related Pol polyprotein from transposon TNT 1-94 n=1 Tax=Vitis vinifera TaxID=29760 RepID=A0A438F8G5_VITVI|nr:Retrovirus-related Pol polyprotein from transposon TNT 1-94 [Vitis vinifera]
MRLLNASDFLAEIQKRFAKNDKAETSTLLASLISMKYKGKGNVREYIMEMSHLASKLKALKLELSDDLLVHLVLISLPAQFNQFKVSYNCQKDKWTLNELISFCVQEEERLKQDKTESAHLASTSKNKGKRNNKDNKVAANVLKTGPDRPVRPVEPPTGQLFGSVRLKEPFYGRTGIEPFKPPVGPPNRTNRPVFIEHLKHMEFMCFRCGTGIGLPQRLDAWQHEGWPQWLDAWQHEGWTRMHGSMRAGRGCLSYRKPSDAERCIYVGDDQNKEIGVNRATDVLELIHTDICGPYPTASWNGQQYFITFIDDYSRYGYLFLIHEKSQSLDVFKTFKAEVELQLNKRIKSVRSDHGGEYYGRYDGSGEQHPGPFAKYLEECGIVPQYTMPGSPSMNGVAERRNRTLKDMVRSMISHSTLPEKLWGEALKTAAYILNRLKRDLISLMKRNWTLKQLAATLLAMQSDQGARNIVFEEEKGSTIAFDNVQVSLPIIDQEVNLDPQPTDNIVQPLIANEDIAPEEQTQQPQENMSLRRSTRERRNAISDDYIVYLQEREVESGMMEDDPINFQQAMKSSNSQKWIEAMNEEYKSMQDNKVWELVPITSWLTQKEGIDFKETFSPVSTKDSFRIIMALVAHYDLELHQMDVKTEFLNGDIDETIYMVQPENFVSEDSKNMVCKLTKSIYGLKQASRQWYFKFHQIIVSYGFEANLMDECDVSQIQWE